MAIRIERAIEYATRYARRPPTPDEVERLKAIRVTTNLHAANQVEGVMGKRPPPQEDDDERKQNQDQD